MMTHKINCCMGCVPPKRHIGCHADCEEYMAERKALDERNAEEYMGRKEYRVGVEIDITSIERAKRLSKKRWR